MRHLTLSSMLHCQWRNQDSVLLLAQNHVSSIFCFFFPTTFVGVDRVFYLTPEYFVYVGLPTAPDCLLTTPVIMIIVMSSFSGSVLFLQQLFISIYVFLHVVLICVTHTKNTTIDCS